MLELDDAISWTVLGKEPFEARLEIAQTLRRWMTPLQPFREHQELRQRRLVLAK